jgi:hypothetical protein
VPDLDTTEAVTVSGSLVFTGGGLILAAGKVFTLNSGGYVNIGTSSIFAGSTTIKGSWTGGNTAAVFTATSGSTSTITGALSSIAGGTISLGTASTLTIDSATIAIDETSAILLVGTNSTIKFANGTSLISFNGVATGNVAGAIANLGGTGVVYGTAAGGSLVSITGVAGGGSISVGTETVPLTGETPVQ